LVDRALALSTSSAAVVVVQVRWEANLRWARTTLTTNGEMSSTSITVVSLAGVTGGTGVASLTRSAPSLDDLVPLVAASDAAAAAADPADDARELIAGVAAPGWDDEPPTTGASALAPLAGGLGDVFAAATADGIEHFGYAEHSVTTTYLGTSTGLRRRFAQPEGRLELTAKSHERTRSVWAGRAAADLSALDLSAVDHELRRGLAWQERTVAVPPGRHPALLTPSAVSDLLIDLYWSSVGRDAAEGRSVWSSPEGATRMGEQVGRSGVRMWSDPAFPGLECVPFVTAVASSGASSVFDNGLDIPASTWIDGGRLEALITTRASAAETGLPLHPGVENLIVEVEGASGTLDDLVARTERGLLVTCLWYNRVVDPQTLLLTGLTRDGVYLVEKGEVVGSVGNFRFNESPVGVLDRTVDAGATVPTLAREMGDYFNRAAMPPVLVDGFNFSTASQAS
jgi:predicted Zn-dependent protease